MRLTELFSLHDRPTASSSHHCASHDSIKPAHLLLSVVVVVADQIINSAKYNNLTITTPKMVVVMQKKLKFLNEISLCYAMELKPVNHLYIRCQYR